MNNTVTQKITKTPISTDPVNQKQDELIMVVKRTDLFGENDNSAWQGLRQDNLQTYLDRMSTQHTFMPRSRMETDPTYKQIIPYLIFTHDNKYFLMQRRAAASEQRLRNKMSLGIGGHLRAEDLDAANTANTADAPKTDLFSWARREFHEEVTYNDTFETRLFGIINDDSNDVGKVHIGPVIILSGTSANISIRSEHKSGSLVSADECSFLYDSLESWSQIVLKALLKTP